MTTRPIAFFTSALLALAFAATLLVTETGTAIPAYARKYDMSCNVCHSAVPVLKPYGEAFAANGYQILDKEPPRFTRETGDDMLYLMRELPLAIRIDGFARYLPDADVKGDMQWPFIIKILSSGQIKRDISYFFYFLFNEEGEVAGVEDAFLHFNDVGGGPFDVIIGQYQVADPVFKRELRPTFEDYEIYKAKPGLSTADLAYDRGITLNYTLPIGTEFFASVVNGNGIGAASGGVFDDDANKNFFLRLAQPVDSMIKIGALGYFGREDETGQRNEVTMAGGDFNFGLGNLELGGQYLYRHDTNPYFGGDAVYTRGGFARLMFSPEGSKGRWFCFAIYNKIDSDQADLVYQAAAGNLSYYVARNLKLTAEYGYDIEYEASSVTIGFMTAF
jgi:hypothetical protein